MLEDDAARLQRIGEPQLKQVRAGHVFQRWVVMVPGLEDIWVFSLDGGTPKSPILIGFSIINHPFWGTPIFGNTHIMNM